jgi:ribose transport system permease protein
MAIRSLGQQGIAFAVFATLFAVFSLILPGFLTTANMLTLLRNVTVLGILGLAALEATEEKIMYAAAH